ncbi:MAG TPA: XRE family transcriptional regulator [Limnochordia bacterium]|nr:XRE family transcriptional regulator [Limnochordia bacterium]
MNVGEQLRALRTRQNLTLTDVASRTGLSVSFLSQLERDQVNASLSSLGTVVEALGANLVDLFAKSSRHGVTVVRADRPLVLSDEEAGAHYRFLSDGSPSPIVPCRARLAPGGSTSERPARHRGYEFAFVLSGSVNYHIGDDVYALDEGDALLFDATSSHRCSNGGDQECEWLWISIDADN